MVRPPASGDVRRAAEVVGDRKDLKGAKTVLIHPAVIVDPGLLTLVDFFASNVNGRQRWRLWRNAANEHASEITLTFGKVFPFVFLSSIGNSEGVLCFCSHESRIDRPVDANGKPFAIRSANALASTLQTGATFHAGLLDTDLFDGIFSGAEAFRNAPSRSGMRFSVGTRARTLQRFKTAALKRTSLSLTTSTAISRRCPIPTSRLTPETQQRGARGGADLCADRLP